MSDQTTSGNMPDLRLMETPSGSMPDPRMANREPAVLAQRYGQPLVVHEPLPVQRVFSAVAERPQRVAEVVPVILRPGGRVLTITKSSYPPDTYRLPSGGVHHGERILDALLRETYEETGLMASVRRFLAVITYHLATATGERERFRSYVFLLDGEGAVRPLDAQERITDVREVEPAELRRMAAHLEALPDTDITTWHDWGRFRAVVHRVVADILTGG